MAALPASDLLVSKDPHDGSTVGELRVSTRDEVQGAVRRARAAQAAWAALGVEGRAALVAKAEPLLVAAAEELGSLVHREMGKPLADAIGEAKGSGSGLARHADMARKALEVEIHRERNAETQVRRDPLGVVAVITPWNFPLWMAASLLYPALLTGNTVVHKPSEKTPLAGAKFAGLLASVLPPGVLEVVNGAGDVGAALVESDVDMVAFVGSQDTGRRIMAACAPTLKRLVLELGGKDPMVVLADADVEAASEFAAKGAFGNAGQVCCSVERILVEKPVAERFLERLAARASDTKVGPLVDEGQRAKVAALVDDARAKGARVLAGGAPQPGPGTYYPPTVLAGVTDDMDAAWKEIFGPVATVRVVESADEALRIANATPYGLGATVWTRDGEQGEAVAARLQAGMIGINRGIRGVGDTPWVGARQSGFGFTGSVEGTRSFTQLRTITRTVS